MDHQTEQAIALTANGIIAAITILANCLKNSGALNDGRFENALRKTIDHPDAESDRLDYMILRRVLASLEGKPLPALRLIHGGLSEDNK